MKKLKVAVIFGGCAEEHLVSCKSAYNIITHMNMEKYEVTTIGITKDGRWMHYTGPADKIIDDNWIEECWCTPAYIVPDRSVHGYVEIVDGKAVNNYIDVVFPVLHGKYGEDGTIQGLLEMAQIPYVGCNLYSSVLCIDKDLAHQHAKNAGVKVTKSVVLMSYEKIEKVEKTVSDFHYPLFVKPASSGSSFGVTKVDKREELENAVEEARKHDNKIIIEEGVSGCEVGCAVLGKEDKLKVGEVDQIELSHGFFRIHQEKKPEESSENSVINVPAHLDDKVVAKIKEQAKIIYNALGCSGIARVDMFLTPENEVVFNEVNSMPGFTVYSRYPRMMEAAGISVSDVVDKIIGLAVEGEK